LSPLRIGLVGAGFMGSVHAEGWAACPGAELTAVTTGTRGDAEGFAERHGIRACADLAELLDQVDVVDICTPTDLHHEAAEAAAAAGRHVICEKPLARTAEQAAEMIAACERAGVWLLVAHVVRFFPEYAAARAAVAEGRIGEPAVLRLARSTFRPRTSSDTWYGDHARSGGMVLDLMIHDFDYARWVAGDVHSVYARSVTAAQPHAGIDHALAVLRHTGGALTHVQGSWAYPEPVFRTGGEIAGTEGLADFDSERDAPLRPLLRGAEDAPQVPLASSPLAESPYTTQLRHFTRVLHGEAEPRITAADALAALRIAEAAARSIAEGRPVEVGPAGEEQ
jgi:myo-inositol 2-dehydrogenase / D-chiro-inositol 1-dehydrogenase